MKKKLEDYLHLYLGAPCLFGIKVPEQETHLEEATIDIRVLHNVTQLYAEVKPILRPLSSMTEEEFKEFDRIITKDFAKMTIIESVSKEGDYTRFSHTFNSSAYLLSKHFDLFGLIEAGLAIDSTALTNSEQNAQACDASKD